MTLSLRARLVAGIVVLMAFGLAIADIAAVVLLRSYLLERIDEQLTVPFNRVARAGPDPAPNPCSRPEAAEPDAAQQLPTDFVLTIVDASGQVHCQLPRGLDEAETPDLSGLSADGLAAAAASDEVLAVPGRDDSPPWRARAVRLDSGFVITGISTAQAEATAAQLGQLTVATSLVILVLGATGGLALVRIGLRPLTAIESTADAIARGDLSRRIAEAPANTEVGRLSAALNTMLTRIEEALTARAESEERLRRFVADASHELRTPITTIHGHAELYRQGAAGEAEVASLLGRVEAESIRMGVLVDDLLLLARMDAAPELDDTPVDLLSVAAPVVVDARVHDPGRVITLKARSEPPWADEPPVVRGDQARLHQVLANLVSNALRHTPSGRPVEVEVGVRDDRVLCRVIDHGPGLTPETATKVFERFYRGDASRTRQTGGTGLGLAIVASLVQAHGGSVWHEPTPGGGSTFVVSLPAGP